MIFLKLNDNGYFYLKYNLSSYQNRFKNYSKQIIKYKNLKCF